MPGERQLPAGSKDAHPVVRLRLRRPEQENRLRQIRPARQGRHLLIRQAIGLMHHRQRITAKRISGKYVYLRESMAGHGDAPALELKGLGTSTAEDYRPPGALSPVTKTRWQSGTMAGAHSGPKTPQGSGPEQKDIQKTARRHRTHAGGCRPQIGTHHAGLVGHVLPVADKYDARADADQIGQGKKMYPAVPIKIGRAHV